MNKPTACHSKGNMFSSIKKKIFLFCIAVILSAGCSSNSDNSGEPPQPSLVRETVNGQVSGVEDAYGTLSWLGIKYARAPQGELRWMAPRDPDSWQGIRNADSFCNACVQYGTTLNWIDYDLFGKPQGCEDCLCLNIWRPDTLQENLPVFVYIHGGANLIGSSSLDVYNGAHLSSKANMIVVTINYRLGLMGWFYHPVLNTGDSLDDSGNYGTLDIIKSLEWVRDNIESFGGNPANVTIAGQSAGAMNVLSLMVSPRAAGLFHKAAIHSGFMISSSKTSAQKWTLNVIRRLLIQEGRAADNDEADAIIAEEGTALGEYLRNLPAEKIYDSAVATKTGGTSDNQGNISDAMFGIFEDGTVIDERILLKIRDGDYNHVPVIIGCNSSELKMFLMMFLVDSEDMYKLIREYDPEVSTMDVEDIIGAGAAEMYEQGVSAGQVVFSNYGVDYTAGLLTGNGDEVYAYSFVWENGTGPFKFLLGGSHAEDVPFLFGNFLPQGQSLIGLMWSDANEPERNLISNEMMAYWGSFAWYGDPNISSDQPQWDEYGGGMHLVIGQGIPHMTDNVETAAEVECPACVIDGVLESMPAGGY